MLAAALLVLLTAVQVAWSQGITAGTRSATGGTLLANQSVSPSAATFYVMGNSSAVYSIELPADNDVTLDDGDGHYMDVDLFTSNPSGSGQLSSAFPGTQTLKVGARLHVGTQQAVGAYTGTYEVTIAFN
jgi:hypothetical protein